MSEQGSSPRDPDSLRIGEWLLVPSTHTLSRDGESHRLPRRLVDLLRLLASRPGQTWSREELLAAAWSRRVVNDEVLSRAVAELRNLLGDDARSPRYIETLPKTGYRLVATVVEGADPRVPAPEVATSRAPGAPPLRWILVAALLLAVLAWGLSSQIGQRRSADDGPAAATATVGGWTAADLARAQPFRSNADWARQPRYSQDGRWLVQVVSSFDPVATWLEWSAADGSAPRRLDTGQGRPAGPVFSPDGSSLAFAAWHDGLCQVRVLQLPAGTPRSVAECAGTPDASLDWPAAGRLLFTGPPPGGDHGLALWQVDPASGRAESLTAPPATAGGDSHPRESRRGQLAFLRGSGALQELWLRADGTERRLVEGAHRIPGMAWTPDGTALLLASDQDGFPALHQVDVDGDGTRLLGARGAATLDVSPQGALLYEQRRYEANLWSYGAGAPVKLTDSTRYDAFAAVSPDGRRMLYVSNREGNGSVWLREADGTEQRLHLPPDIAWLRPQWLGDSGLVLLTRYVTSARSRVDVFDPASQRLVEGHPLAGPGFAPVALDTRRIVVGIGHGNDSSAGDEGMVLVLRDGAGDHPVPQARQVDRFNSDGRWIGWTRLGDPRLHLFDTAGGTGHALLSPDGSGERGWTLHAGELHVVRRDAAGWALWRQQLPDGEPQRWLDLRTAPTDGQVVVAADGRAILSHVDVFTADLLLVSGARIGRAAQIP